MYFKCLQVFSKKILFVGVLAGSLLVSGCEDLLDELDDGNGIDEVEVVAAFDVSPANIETGDEVTLDGSASSVAGADDLSFVWELNAPDGSSAELNDPSAEVTTFTADEEGAYEVTLEVSADDVYDSESQDVMVGLADVQELSSDISDDMTLESDVLYQVTSNIDIEAVLEIEPGTRIEFESNTGFRLTSVNGVIKADGTEDEPIVFTGTSQQPGWWNGIYLEESDHIDNQLNHVIVEYGGGEDYRRSGSGNIIIGRGLRDDSAIDITNSTIRYSGSYGIWVRSNADMPEFGNNVITDNQDVPINISSKRTHRLDAESDYSGNAEDYINVRAHDLDEDDVKWNTLNAHYRITSSTIEIDGVNLTIEAGATLEFESGGQLRLVDQGGLIADGEAGNEILFTGSSHQPGWWDGIYLEESSNLENKLNHVIVEYAGGNEYRRSGEGNVVIGRGLRDRSAITITNSTFQHSASNGLWIRSNGSIPDFENNTITANDDSPVNIGSNHVYMLDSESTYTGNDDEFVYVRGGHDIDDEDVTWENLDVDYQISSSTVEVTDGVVLTIQPGTRLAFESNGQLRLTDEGGLHADGESDNDRIVFTATSEQAGWWDGIYLEESSNSMNELNYVTVEYAGGNDYRRSGQGNVVIGRNNRNDSSMQITNSIINHSEAYGLWVRSNGNVNDDACDVNDFNNNPSGDCEIN